MLSNIDLGASDFLSTTPESALPLTYCKRSIVRRSSLAATAAATATWCLLAQGPALAQQRPATLPPGTVAPAAMSSGSTSSPASPSMSAPIERSPGIRPLAPVVAPAAGAAAPSTSTTNSPTTGPTISAAELDQLASRATVMQDLPANLTLYVGQMALVRMPNVARVAIGSGKVLEARVLDGNNMLITAQDAGDSTLHVWDKAGRVRKVKVRVNIIDLERIEAELREITKGMTGVNIRRIGERIVMDGSNLDPGAVERLGTVAQLYSPAVVSLATADRIRVDRMVDIQVRIVEFNKTALDDLGVRWQGTTNGGFSLGLFSDIASSGSYRVLPADTTFTDATPAGAALLSRNQRTPQSYFGVAATLGSQINLLVQRGNAFLLATPNLSTRSGGEAKFLAGGEFPLPALSTQGAGSVEFKPYGVRLNIKPIADGAGNVSGSILTEVSSIDRSVAVQGIPGLLIRRTDTEFNVRDGETIVLSGLIKRESSRASDGLPGLRRAPIIGRAFRADTDTDTEQEVVVFITPRVVDPAYSAPRIERANRIEDQVNRGFGNLVEDQSKPATGDGAARRATPDGAPPLAPSQQEAP
ncbi:pilus assembly protein N-terminal domain-containing protein [Variovorax sp. LG9.2]|nr:pilus assembly protein N-terminal domain-containing protein [Variovorax sp. LG9.2]